MRTGDVRQILSGDRFIHSLFHLDRPSVTMVVRTKHDSGTDPQYSYFPPGIAYDPFVADERLSRLVRFLDVFDRRSSGITNLLADLIGRGDHRWTWMMLTSVGLLVLHLDRRAGRGSRRAAHRGSQDSARAARICKAVPDPSRSTGRCTAPLLQGTNRRGACRGSRRSVPLRSAQHNERLMRYYHAQLCNFFARLVGQPIKPTYGYFASYRRGAVLKKHVDREQCKYTASLLIDYVAAVSDDQAWPLYLELPNTGEQIDIRLAPGDAALYRGCELPHYRDELRGQSSTSFFLHYVDEGFARCLE
jgi:hypothetical protein